MEAVRNVPADKKKFTSLEDRLKTDFVTLSSHQLRTPLSAVKWYAEMLLSQRAGKLTKKQLQYLQEIHRSNERAIALLNDLLQVSRVEEGRVHLDLDAVNLVNLVEEVIDANREELNANGLAINLEVRNGPLAPIRVDKVKLRRVIDNLIANAVTYTPRGGSISVVIKNDPREILCSVTDTGIGIPSDEQDGIFGRFFRGTNATKLQPNGTGLGLFIAKAFVVAHGGKIWFDSTEGKGSTFYFTVPVPKK